MTGKPDMPDIITILPGPVAFGGSAPSRAVPDGLEDLRARCERAERDRVRLRIEIARLKSLLRRYGHKDFG